MPTATGLTEMQEAFVINFTSAPGDQTAAAELAGFAHPAVAACQLMQKPHVRAAIRARFETLIQCEGASLAWKVVREAMTDVTWPKHLRLDAAKFTLKAGGYEQKDVLPPHDKPLSEMTVAEIEAFVAKGHDALDALKIAQVVELEPASDTLSLPAS